MARTELGAKLTGVTLDHERCEVVGQYELCDAKGVGFGTGGEVRIGWDALDAIDAAIGGREPLTIAQRMAMATAFFRPRFERVAVHLERVDPPPDVTHDATPDHDAPPPERRDAFVTAEGPRAHSSHPKGP